MDNRSAVVVSEGHEALSAAIRLLWPNAAGGMATHYKIANIAEVTKYYGLPETARHITEFRQSEDGKPTLILLWHAEKDAKELPYPLDLDGAVLFAQGWLSKADYGNEHGHDGDSGKGFRVFSDYWGHVAGHSYGIFGLQPTWAMYGK